MNTSLDTSLLLPTYIDSSEESTYSSGGSIDSGYLADRSSSESDELPSAVHAFRVLTGPWLADAISLIHNAQHEESGIRLRAANALTTGVHEVAQALSKPAYSRKVNAYFAAIKGFPGYGEANSQIRQFLQIAIKTALAADAVNYCDHPAITGSPISETRLALRCTPALGTRISTVGPRVREVLKANRGHYTTPSYYVTGSGSSDSTRWGPTVDSEPYAESTTSSSSDTSSSASRSGLAAEGVGRIHLTD